MILDDLEPYFDELSFDEKEKIDILHNKFVEDFINSELHYKGKRLCVKSMKSEFRNFENYIEGFVHVVTRKSDLKKQRLLVCERANRVHWIKPILENHDDNRIKYFTYIEGDGALREYYWYKEKDYIVITEDIGKDYLLITAFTVDAWEVKKYNKRYVDYLHSIK